MIAAVGEFLTRSRFFDDWAAGRRQQGGGENVPTYAQGRRIVFGTFSIAVETAADACGRNTCSA